MAFVPVLRHEDRLPYEELPAKGEQLSMIART